MKKNINFGIIVGQNSHHYLSLDEYAEHFLLPFSPRFCNIDFSVSSLSSLGIKDIVILVKRDKDIVQNYLVKGWPLINFTVFDYIDVKEKFVQFLTEYQSGHTLDLLVIMKGNYPVWFDMNVLKSELEKQNNIGFKTQVDGKSVYSGMVVEKNLFVKKYENLLLDESSLEIDIVEKIIKEFMVPTIDTHGYIMPFKSLKEYYDVHIGMLEDYLLFDRFNSYVPIRGDLAMNISSNLGKGSYIINSIFGENVEVSGKVENSIIFSNVKIDRGAVIKNSLILPGNHIGSNVQIVNSIIDEYSEDNTLPNIESYANIGSERPQQNNQQYPDTLNFGVTLVGKDVRIPASMKIGGNCYIDSFIPVSVLKETKVVRDGTSVMRRQEV